MDKVGNWPRTAAVFGATGGIGRALCHALADGGCERIYAGSRSGEEPVGEGIVPFAFDLTDESTIKAAAYQMRDTPPEWVIVASGVLTLSDGTGPERTYKRLSAQAMAEVLDVPTGTVRSRLHRARAEVRRRMAAVLDPSSS